MKPALKRRKPGPPGRPPKPEGEHAQKFTITLLPRAARALDEFMGMDGEDNRSRMVSQLIIAEHKRRERAKLRSRTRSSEARPPARR